MMLYSTGTIQQQWCNHSQTKQWLVLDGLFMRQLANAKLPNAELPNDELLIVERRITESRKLPNVEYYQTSNVTERRILQNIEYYRM